MKQVVTVKDFTGKVITNTINVRNEMHFNIQRNTRANIFKDKTKYTRKEKHKISYCF